ncbi:MAG TPA: BrnT family toxin [Dehalococcoidia bacterium]|nr:BrnT family toxin [Dehalococcoidia bacterium]
MPGNAWNVGHIARHQVAPTEVEDVCHGTPMFSDTYRERLRVVGPTSTGRMLTVILAHEGNDIYYVVTARPASRRERRRYQEVSGDTTP